MTQAIGVKRHCLKARVSKVLRCTLAGTMRLTMPLAFKAAGVVLLCLTWLIAWGSTLLPPAWLRALPPTVQGWLTLHQWWIAAVSLFIQAIGAFLIPAFYVPWRTLRTIRHKTLNQMCDGTFGGNRQTMRYTIFRPAGGVRRSLIYLRIVLRYCWRRVLMQRPVCMPPGWPWRYNYLVISQRLGTEHRFSRTHFRYSNHSEKDSDGLAALVWHTEQASTVTDLPEIDRELVKGVDKNRRHSESSTLEAYMKRSRASLESLLQLNVYSRHFHGELLYGKNGQKEGVLMIDCRADIDPFTSESLAEVKNYIGFLQNTFH